MSSNSPLELSDKRFGKLDKMQKDLICKQNALDLVLLENANELFRMLMQEGENNENIENVLKLIGKERENSVFMPTQTFEINQMKNGEWTFTKTAKNKNLLKKYIKNCDKHIKDKVYEDSIIYTVIGLDLGEGGHYGAMVCDMEDKMIYVFDSMSGTYGGDYTTSGTEDIFLLLAKQIFKGDKTYSGLDLDLDDFEVEAVENNYFLQPTGGFEDFTAPVLSHLLIGNNPKWKKYVEIINIQHTESQNHFCYIWSMWFCHIYLRGKTEHFEEVMAYLEVLEMIPLVVIKKYILGFIQLLNDKVEYNSFFYERFPQIWSNHENPLENKFELYEFKWKKPKTIEECLDNSYDDYKIKMIAKTSDVRLKEILKCK